VAARDELRGLIVAAFADMTGEQVVTRLDEAQIANARVNTMDDVWAHPQLKARQRWVQVETPAGQVPALLPPGVPDAGHVRIEGVPALGAHTEAIIGSLGYSADDIARLRKDRAI
jgi:itaconate CoA-transferase